MKRREQQIYEEAAALWRELFHEPPPRADGPLLLDLIMRKVEVDGYERMRSPFLRPSTIVGPGQPKDDNQLS
jgi:hypothetical protein